MSLMNEMRNSGNIGGIGGFNLSFGGDDIGTNASEKIK